MTQENESWAVGDDLPLLDEGVYDATVTRIEDDHSKLYNKDQLRIVFVIGEYELTRWVTKPDGAVRPRMAFFKIAEALLGPPLKDHGHFTRDDLVGKSCQIVVKIETKDDGTTQNRIDSVLKPPDKNQGTLVAQAKAAGAKPTLISKLATIQETVDLDTLLEAIGKADLNDAFQLNEDGDAVVLDPNAGIAVQAKVVRLLKDLAK